MNGRLAVASITTANTWQNIYRISTECMSAKVDISVVNGNSSDVTCKVAFCATTTPASNEFTENGVLIAANGGRLIMTDEKLSPGEYIFVQTSIAGCVVRVSGDELVEV